MALSSRPRDVFAAIDIGTNAARLLVSELTANGRFRALRAQRDPIRPGEGVFRTGRIAPKVTQRIVSTVRGFAHTCDGLNARVRAVATSSLRDAENGADVRTYIFEQTGIDVEIISGEEEARLICMAVLEHALPNALALVVDIGGGSTEVTIAKGRDPLSLNSLPLGTVRLTELFDASEIVSAAQLKEMRSFARGVISAQFHTSDWQRPGHVYGSSGTIRSLASYVGPKKSRVIALSKLSHAVESLASLSARERRKHFEVSRADVIVSGAVVLESLLQVLGLDEVHSVDRGLRDGILLDLLAKRQAPRTARPRTAAG